MAELSLDLPEGWFRLDLDPATRRSSAEALVASWLQVRPDLADARERLVESLANTAEQALASSALLAAGAFGTGPEGPTYVGLVARVLPWPGNLDVDGLLTGLAGAARADGATSADRVQIAGRPMLLVRRADDGQAVTSFVVPMRGEGVFTNLEFTTGGEIPPEHTFSHIVATARVVN